MRDSDRRSETATSLRNHVRMLAGRTGIFAFPVLDSHWGVT